MKQHLHASAGPFKDLAATLKNWKSPRHARPVPLGDVFLLTYVNASQALQEDTEESIDKHTGRVRKVCSDCHGEEVRHTGKGIFARFNCPDDAICAAISIQQDWDRLRKSENPVPPSSVAVVSSAPDEADPAISGAAFSQADTICRRLDTSQIACDVLIRDVCTMDNVHFGAKIPNAHSGISERINAVEIIWAPVPS